MVLGLQITSSAFKTKIYSLKISKYNGEYLVRGGKISHHEGKWKPKRMVVVKFPSRERALAFYHSEEYKKFKAIRNKVAETNLIFVDGIE